MLDKNRCLHTIVHLKMDNTGGQELDTATEVQGGHHAQILGSTAKTVPGMCGHHDTAVSLAGNRYDMIRFDDGRFMTGLVEFSVSMWVRPHTFSGTPGLFSVYSTSDEDELVMLLTPTVVCSSRPAEAAGSTRQTTRMESWLREWNHVGFSLSQDGTPNIWVNGVHSLVDTATSKATIRKVYRMAWCSVRTRIHTTLPAAATAAWARVVAASTSWVRSRPPCVRLQHARRTAGWPPRGLARRA